MTTLAAALALLDAAAAPLGLPPIPAPDAGYAALWEWLRDANAQLSIPDTEFRWMFGGISIPILLLFEGVGIRRDWRLYPFLLPFWLIFGGVALGVLGGLAATAAHLVLFPVGRVWFMVSDRRRTSAAGAPGPSEPASAPRPPPQPAQPPRRPQAARTIQDALRAVAAALREEQRRAAAAPGRARPPALGTILRSVGDALGGAVRAGMEDAATPRPPPLPPLQPAPPPGHPAHPPGAATGEAPGRPDMSAFRPDLSRFRRRPPRG